MLENLQEGDILSKQGALMRTVLGVSGVVVFWKVEGDPRSKIGMGHILDLVEDGWQLEKKKWVPCKDSDYYFINGHGEVKKDYWTGLGIDQFRLSINNVHQTRDEAWAYRNKLVEVMGKEGV